jgi:hypothetical protein
MDDKLLKSFDNLFIPYCFLSTVVRNVPLGKCAKRDRKEGGNPLFFRNILSFSQVTQMCQKVTSGDQSGHFPFLRPLLYGITFFKITSIDFYIEKSLPSALALWDHLL